MSSRTASRKASSIVEPAEVFWLALLNRLRAVRAACWILANGVVLIRAIAVVARLAHGVRHSRNLIRGVHVLIIDRHLAAVGDRECVTGLLSTGKIRSKKLRRLRCRCARLRIA